MLRKNNLILLATAIFATSAWAQSASQPLNLRLPPESVPPQNATAVPASNAKATSAPTVQAPAAATTQPSPANSTLSDTHYDASANRTVDAADAANHRLDAEDSANPSCDDATRAQPQVHGSVGMGVVAGNHVSGNYQTGGVQVTKALGSCDHPTGGVSLSIDVGRANFGNSRGRH